MYLRGRQLTCLSEPPSSAPERHGRHPLFSIAFAGLVGTPFLLATTFTAAVTNRSAGRAQTYPCRNIDLMSFLALDDIGGGSGTDIWGWKDSLTGWFVLFSLFVLGVCSTVALQ